MNDLDENTNAGYPIGIVTRRTGLSPDVLRVWERRYAVVTPTRSSGGQRVYSASDIEKLRLLRRLVEGGHRIASVARLDLDALAALSREIEVAPPPVIEPRTGHEAVDSSLEAVAKLDASALEMVLRRSAMTLGSVAWVDTVVGPLLERVGERWHEGSITPAHEHLATATVRDALLWVVRSFGVEASSPSMLVATPAEELHELGAMMAAALAAGEGWRVHYLGPNVPASDIAKAARQLGVAAVALSLILPDHASRAVQEVAAIRRLLPATIPIMMGGQAAIASASALTEAGATVIENTNDFRNELARVTPAI